jgi:hypothetical protein
MKYIIVILFLASIITSQAHIITKGIQILQHSNNTNQLSLCGVCNNFISNSIKQLINVILQSGVIGGCDTLCTKAFPNQKTEENVCNMLCDAVGVYTFINLIQRYSGDLDPIYFCELVHACPIHDGGSAHLDKLTITPTSGPIGTTFEIDVTFTVFNQTSTGEIVISVKPPKSDPFGDGVLDTGFTPGRYNIKFSLETNPSEEEAFEYGTYIVELFGCDGECESKLPHSTTLFNGISNFTISG